jgi:hypothetical protein
MKIYKVGDFYKLQSVAFERGFPVDIRAKICNHYSAAKLKLHFAKFFIS